MTGEVTNTNVIVFSLTRSGLEPTIYHKRANRYTTDVVIINQQKQKENTNTRRTTLQWKIDNNGTHNLCWNDYWKTLL